ncbi:MAG: hypothetical protein QXH88_00005, partial [Sulfolobales archaeon]
KSVIDSKESIKGTIEIALVPDEEAGGAGSRYFAVKRLSEPDYVILGEPTTNGIIGIGHKGMIRAMVRSMVSKFMEVFPGSGITPS